MATLNENIFTALFWTAQLLALVNIVLVLVWTNNFLGGFAWQNDPFHEFNYHIVFAVIGQVVLYGEGLLVFRAMRYKPKMTLKIMHAVILLMTFISTVVSLKTAFDSHNYRSVPIPNLYSLHSWTGLTAVVLFSLQLCCGFCAFIYPGVYNIYKKEYLPLHKFFGLLMFILSTITCHSGITQKVKASLGKEYLELPPAALAANFLGVTITLFAVIVIYLVATPQYKRSALVEEDSVEMASGYGQF